MKVPDFVIEEVDADELEKEVMAKPKLHMPSDGRDVVGILQARGYHAHLIGSTAMGSPSAHDIDVLLVRDAKSDFSIGAILALFQPRKFTWTSNPSLYLHDTYMKLDVDIFFEGFP